MCSSFLRNQFGGNFRDRFTNFFRCTFDFVIFLHFMISFNLASSNSSMVILRYAPERVCSSGALIMNAFSISEANFAIAVQIDMNIRLKVSNRL